MGESRMYLVGGSVQAGEWPLRFLEVFSDAEALIIPMFITNAVKSPN